MEQFFRLQEGEKIVHKIKPLPGLKWYFFFRRFATIVPVAIIAFFYLSFSLIGPESVLPFLEGFGVLFEIGFLILIGLVIGVVASLIISRLEYGKQDYWITDKRVIYKRGIIGYRITSIPYERISDVIISRTFLERIFGFGSLHIQSLAGQMSGKSSLGTEGVLLAIQDPEDIQELIFKLVKMKRKAEGLSF